MIHCDEHTERNDIINETQKILQQPIKLFKGYYTRNNAIDIDSIKSYLNEYDSNMILVDKDTPVFTYPGELGCYLSHHMLIKYIDDNDDKNNISIIFEDDVVIPPNLHDNIIKIVDTLDKINPLWHIVFLRSLLDHRYISMQDNIYYIYGNTWCWGTHALIINNKNSHEIYSSNCNVENSIDTQYVKRSHETNLYNYTIYPSLCHQSSLPSNIK